MTNFVTVLGLFMPIVVAFIASYGYYKSMRAGIVISAAIVELLIISLFAGWTTNNWHFDNERGAFGGWVGTIALWVIGVIVAGCMGKELAQHVKK